MVARVVKHDQLSGSSASFARRRPSDAATGASGLFDISGCGWRGKAAPQNQGRDPGKLQILEFHEDSPSEIEALAADEAAKLWSVMQEPVRRP
jgi:hypothetical protein